ncbi:MAG: hypothetical protein D6731_01735 [Planctomycetota bacterium]|nr:MAG: hypothetical protein D6731_01735 [Planctomycetota bacterium]
MSGVDGRAAEAGVAAAPAGPRRRALLLVAGLLAAVLCLQMVVFTVQDTQTAVVLTFGKPTAEQQEAGLGFKWPWPIQEVKPFDARLRVLSSPLEEMITKDGRAVLVGSFALWRVRSAKTFLETFKGETEAETVADAERFLVRRLRNHQTAVVSSYPFAALVSAERADLKYEEVERRILAGLAADAASAGVEVRTVGIRRLTLPKSATEAVFERMRADRKLLATKIRREGQEKADAIRRRAEEERARLLLEAERDARDLLAEADRKAGPAYRAMAADPELAVFLKKLEALEKLLTPRPGKPGPTLVLDTDQPPFDLLRGPARSPGAGGTKPGEKRR